MNWIKFTFFVLLLGSTPGLSQTNSISYSGRLVDSTGSPVAGPVDLKVDFFRNLEGGSEIGIDPVTKSGVKIYNGIFQIDLSLSDADYHKVFNGKDQVWIQITDLTSNKIYGRQKFQSVPYALKIPIDGNSLTYDSKGRLQVDPSKLDLSSLDNSSLKLGSGGSGSGSVTMKANNAGSYTLTLPVDNGNAGQVLQTDGDGNLNWTNAGGADSNAETLCSTGQYLDGDGTCRTNAYIVTNGGGLTSETDPNVTAFAKAALPTCGVGEVLKGDGTSLSCVTDADTADTNTNAQTECASGEYLDGDGTCRTNGYIVTNGGGLTSVDWTAPGTIGSGSPNTGVFTNTTTDNVTVNNSLIIADAESDTVTITAAADANYSLTLPVDDGDPGQVLQTNGTGVLTWTSAAADTNTNAQTECASGEYLDGDGTCRTNAYIVTNGGGLTSETDSSVTAFAKAALPTCGVGEVLKGDGTSLSCVTDANTADTNAQTECASGEYLDGDGTCRTNAYIVTNGGGLTSETDSSVTAFAKAALPTCGVGEVLKGDGTSLSCVTDANTADTNAQTECASGEYLDGDGTCRTNAYIVSNGGGVTSESDPQVGTNSTNYLSKWNGSALVTSGVLESGGLVGIGTTNPSSMLEIGGAIEVEAANPTFVLKETDVADENWDLQVNGGNFKVFEVNDARSVFDERLTILSGGNVGIGTSTANEALTVAGDIKVLGLNRLHFSNTSDRSYVGAPASDMLAFGTSGVEAVRINTLGHVGIGTNVPNELLSVEGTVSLVEQVSAPGTQNAGYGKIYAKTDGKLYFQDDAATEYDLTAGAAIGGGIPNGIQSFTSSGTFTVPAGVTKVFVELWGAGGGGSAATGSPGTAGGATSFGAYLSATGGGGATGGSFSDGGAGGSGSGGDINLSGGAGGDAVGAAGAGGGGAPRGGAGGPGSYTAYGVARNGVVPGGGGGGFVTGGHYAGGGGAGGYSAELITGLTPGANITVTIGAGGSGPSSAGEGASGMVIVKW